MVAARPSIWISPPVNPPGRFTLQRSVEASLANIVCGGVTLVVPGWEFYVDTEPHIVAARRHFPQDIIGFG